MTGAACARPHNNTSSRTHKTKMSSSNNNNTTNDSAAPVASAAAKPVAVFLQRLKKALRDDALAENAELRVAAAEKDLKKCLGLVAKHVLPALQEVYEWNDLMAKLEKCKVGEVKGVLQEIAEFQERVQTNGVDN